MVWRRKTCCCEAFAVITVVMYLIPSCHFRRHVLPVVRSLLPFCPCRRHVLATMSLLPEMILPHLLPSITSNPLLLQVTLPQAALSGDDDTWPKPAPPHSWDFLGPLESAPAQAQTSRDSATASGVSPSGQWKWRWWHEKGVVVWRSGHPGRWAARKRSHRSQCYLKRLIVQKIRVRSKRRDSPDPTFPPGLWIELYLVIGETGIYAAYCMAYGQCSVALSFHYKNRILDLFSQVQLFVVSFHRYTKPLGLIIIGWRQDTLH